MHNEPKTRHPECPDVHMGVCPKCRRLYERDRKAAERIEDASSEAVPALSVLEDVGVEEVSAPPHPQCGERHILTNAERQKKWRDKDPEAYRVWNRERMRKRRQK